MALLSPKYEAVRSIGLCTDFHTKNTIFANVGLQLSCGNDATDESINSVASIDWEYMSVLPYRCDSSPRKRLPDSTLGICKGRWVQARLRVMEDFRIQGLARMAKFSIEGCSPNGNLNPNGRRGSLPQYCDHYQKQDSVTIWCIRVPRSTTLTNSSSVAESSFSGVGVLNGIVVSVEVSTLTRSTVREATHVDVVATPASKIIQRGATTSPTWAWVIALIEYLEYRDFRKCHPSIRWRIIGIPHLPFRPASPRPVDPGYGGVEDVVEEEVEEEVKCASTQRWRSEETNPRRM
ncbi:predicted protein [Aspergillus nidulans FGSC A4]|nr:predicted protein [Aspergillus nidulans FGSC A4]|eukprot:XP_664520.1 predicted protein [Aspergillus nidulans FGSC A4]